MYGNGIKPITIKEQAMNAITTTEIHGYFFSTLNRAIEPNDLYFQFYLPKHMEPNGYLSSFISVSVVPIVKEESILNFLNKMELKTTICNYSTNTTIKYNGIRTLQAKEEKYNKAVDSVIEEFNTNTERFKMMATKNVNTIINGFIEKGNRESFRFLSRVYTDKSNFDFSEDDDPILLKEISDIKAEISLLKVKLQEADEKIRVGRVKALEESVWNNDWDQYIKDHILSILKGNDVLKSHSRFIIG